MPTSSHIDLTKSKTNITDDILKWALSFGRFLIIVVEIVAFSAFIYRFVLDRQIIDLNDKIKREQAIIEASREQENTYRSLQERISTVKKASTNGTMTPKIMREIVEKTPPDITYNSYNIDKEKFQMEVNVTSFPSLTTFLKILKEYPQISSVTITAIDNSFGNVVNVTILARLKEESQ